MDDLINDDAGDLPTVGYGLCNESTPIHCCPHMIMLSPHDHVVLCSQQIVKSLTTLYILMVVRAISITYTVI